MATTTTSNAPYTVSFDGHLDPADRETLATTARHDYDRQAWTEGHDHAHYETETCDGQLLLCRVPAVKCPEFLAEWGEGSALAAADELAGHRAQQHGGGYRVSFEPWRGSHGPTGETVDVGTADSLEAADALVRQHHGRPLPRPVSSHPTIGKAAETATHALHLIGDGTYRYVNAKPDDGCRDAGQHGGPEAFYGARTVCRTHAIARRIY